MRGGHPLLGTLDDVDGAHHNVINRMRTSYDIDPWPCVCAISCSEFRIISSHTPEPWPNEFSSLFCGHTLSAVNPRSTAKTHPSLGRSFTPTITCPRKKVSNKLGMVVWTHQKDRRQWNYQLRWDGNHKMVQTGWNHIHPLLRVHTGFLPICDNRPAANLRRQEPAVAVRARSIRQLKNALMVLHGTCSLIFLNTTTPRSPSSSDYLQLVTSVEIPVFPGF